ncbi:putative Optic atrophy 3 protein (OPA3) [Trypanosoma vivax]|uniref:Optic atrophy 3 protein (OPA3) n=1 Tax=Trypanosoma vivax (strain Y486) TaxID=1055687 RepID=G0UBN8_TRYVY|nr:hypothetical protein TRVL_07614 [Trypanosoma vivax]KAH8609547.1 putative Optic atrophy 3 protein (OPA3) [Trypanosoma vivax]CCC53235.1 conserved hypothetical protein [Trypanosoma vivax Y486]
MPTPLYRFGFLAIRQLTKPMVTTIVRRAHSKGRITLSVCLFLGHLSNGISSVIALWGSEERRAAHKSVGLSSSPEAMNPSSGKPSTVEGKCENSGKVIVAPRTRSLLSASSNMERTGREGVGRFLLLRKQMKTPWQAFRAGFTEAVPEEHLVKEGSQLLTEFCVYFVLASMLFVEIRYNARSVEARERHLYQRLDALEQKVNELVSAGSPSLGALEVPEHPEKTRRFDLVRRGVERITNLFPPR